MNLQNARNYCCCFTGHRPEKLSTQECEIKAALERAIETAIGDGYQTFITGMARGVDIWAAEIVLKLRSGGLPVHLLCAVPYEGFETGWSAAWQGRYQHILHAANQVEYICPGYRPNCFQTRNKWMVDHSARVIAVYNGTSGGTKNTVNYAKLQNVAVTFVEP